MPSETTTATTHSIPYPVGETRRTDATPPGLEFGVGAEDHWVETSPQNGHQELSGLIPVAHW